MSTAYLYSGSCGDDTNKQHTPPPAPPALDPEQEAAMMQAMGLPTALQAGTAEGSGDYCVLASEPSRAAADLALDDPATSAAAEAPPASKRRSSPGSGRESGKA